MFPLDHSRSNRLRGYNILFLPPPNSPFAQMDQIPPPGPPRQFHIRMVSIVSFLMLLDFLFVSYSLETILLEGVSAMIIFASEFVILQATIAGSAARYAVGVIDLRRARGREDAPVWEAKSTYLFYIDLSVGQLNLHHQQIE